MVNELNKASRRRGAIGVERAFLFRSIVSRNAVVGSSAEVRFMRFQQLLRFATCILASLILVGCGDRAQQSDSGNTPATGSDQPPQQPSKSNPPGKKDQLSPFPTELTNAWRDAGAIVGTTEGTIPTIRLTSWQEGMIAKLPAPSIPFALYLGFTQITDAGLKELAGLKNLQSLHIFNTKISGNGLKELSELNNLQDLDLLSTQVTDAGLKVLASLKNLQALNLGNTRVSNVGLKELANLKNLRSLKLNRTLVTDAGLRELTGLTNLKSLNLDQTQITDLGLKELAKFNSLESLNISETKITDAGIKELIGLPNLQELKLGHNKITDKSLSDLAHFKSLKSLFLVRTLVTDAGLKELRRALPDCKIQR
jgi:internalin A